MINNIRAEDAVNLLSKAEYGIHHLIIYPDLTTLRRFYSLYIHKQIVERNEVVQMASFYETGDSVRETLAKGHRSIDVEGLEREKVLVIVDSLKKYFADGENVRSDLDANKKMVDHAKAIGKRGYSILGDIGAFPYLGRTYDLIDYEMFLPTQYSMDMKGLCLYHQRDFDRIAAEHKKELAEHHGMAIRIVSHQQQST